MLSSRSAMLAIWLLLALLTGWVVRWQRLKQPTAEPARTEEAAGRNDE